MNVVGYKAFVPSSFQIRSTKFYMNVVGYKAAHHRSAARSCCRFYMNVVGYKVIYEKQEKYEEAIVLYERSGI